MVSFRLFRSDVCCCILHWGIGKFKSQVFTSWTVVFEYLNARPSSSESRWTFESAAGKKHKIVTSNILYGYFEKSSTFSRNFAGIAENPRYLPETIIKHACKPWFQVREDSKPLAGVLSRAPLCPEGGGYYNNFGSRKREEQLNFWKEGRRYCAWGLMGNDVSVVFFSFLLG